jgi:hypothetical protein
MAWHWPQWIMASFLVLSIIANSTLANKPRKAVHDNGVPGIILVLVMAGVLYAGGFWQ